MPVWILIVFIAQFLHAVASVIDKYIVTAKKVSKPFIYAFFVTVLSIVPILLFLLSPLRLRIGGFDFPHIENITAPDFGFMAMAIVSAFAGFNGLISLYSALRDADASDVVPVVGSISAIGTFILSYIVLQDVLSSNFLFGFIFLVAGTFLISHFRFNRTVLMHALHAGFLFAIKATMIKTMFVVSSFDHAFFWSRIGLLIVVLSLLFVPEYAEKIKFNTKQTGAKGGYWVVGNSILGGIAAFMMLKAIDLGNVTIIQALGGLQFAFLTIFALVFGAFTPATLGENERSPWVAVQKTISVLLIATGFVYLFI